MAKSMCSSIQKDLGYVPPSPTTKIDARGQMHAQWRTFHEILGAGGKSVCQPILPLISLLGSACGLNVQVLPFQN